MAIFAAIPGEINAKPNPGHTAEGFALLAMVHDKLIGILPAGKYLVAEGSGLQFHEVAACLALDLELAGRIVSYACPILGGPEAIDEATDKIVLASGDTVPRAQYLALTDTEGFNPLAFLNSLWGIAVKNGCQHVFLATNGDFISSLLRAAKIKMIKLKPGAVYQICPVPGGEIAQIA
jgi:hypothetical protein